MTGHDAFVQTPAFLHSVLPAYIPQDVDMTVVKAQVATSGVSAPPDAVPAGWCP